MRKKRIYATILATTLFSPLASCTNDFTYEKNEKGETQLTGTVSYDILEKCKLVEITGKNTDEIFITEQETILIYGSPLRVIYTNIINDEIVYDSYEFKYINTNLETVSNFGDYLASYEIIKKEYSKDEIVEILKTIQQDHQLKNTTKKEKRLSKGIK